MPHVERKYTTFLYAKWKICNKSETSRKSANSSRIFTQQVYTTAVSAQTYPL